MNLCKCLYIYWLEYYSDDIVHIFKIATNYPNEGYLKSTIIDNKQYSNKDHGIIMIKQVNTLYLLVMNENIFSVERESSLFHLVEISCRRFPTIQIRPYSHL